MTDTPQSIKPIEVTYEEPVSAPVAQSTNIEEVFGGFPEVTSTPTWVPKNFKDSIAINTSTNTLYYYNTTHNTWKAITTTPSYGGYVNTSASSATLPAGWSASYNGGSKSFTVTHNLSTTSYAVVPVAIGVNAKTYFVPLQVVIASANFQVQFSDTAGTAGNTEWYFTLIPI